MSLATLGPVTFEVSADLVRTWSEARRSGDSRWATHDVHQAKPLREFLGPGLDTITLRIRFDQAFGVVPRDELRTLREQRDAGAVLDFVVGGDLVGDFTIESLSDEWTRVDASGVLTTASVDLTLKEYE